MASSERALIFVESGTELVASKGRTAVVSSASKDRNMLPKMQDKSNYVIKIHIGDETMYNPVRIDVSTGKSSRIGLDKTAILEEDPTFNSSGSSSGQSSPRSDMTPPPRINTGSIRFGSETSESDTESDVSSEYRPIKCPTAQFAMREMLEIEPIRSASTLTNEITGYHLRRQDSAPIQAFKDASSSSSSFGSNLLNTRNHMSLQRSYSSHCPSTPLSLVPEKVNNSMTLSSSNSSSSTSERSFCNTLDLARKNLLKTADMKPAKQDGKLEMKQEEIIDENGFHLDEINDVNSKAVNEASDSLNNFAGYKDIFARTKQDGPAQIKSEKGTIRGVKNRVRDGIATFLQSNDIKVSRS